MAASLHPRHVSPSESSNRKDVLKAQKRKRDSDGGATSKSAESTATETTKSKKKKKTSAHADTTEDFSVSDKGTEAIASDQNRPNGLANTDHESTTEEVSAYPAVAADEAATGLSGARDSPEEATDRVKSTKDTTAKAIKEKRKKARLEDEGGTNKHSKILSKFERAKAKARDTSKSTDETKKQTSAEAGEKEIAVRGLQPLPQPAPVPESQELPSYSSLPSWLAEPYYVSPDLTKDFASIPIDDKTRSALQSKGFAHAFPIQAAVTNLLSPGPDRHDGDICISAATGSGKTLAYALPLVSGIKYSPVSRLRGLVVVPTRELVRQARDTCELCAAGTGLRIGTAVGSTALREEQQQLMVQNQVYDPVSYRSRNDDPLGPSDWAKFNLGEYLAEIEELQKSLPDHVPMSSPNIDILVCTPGRLVDHIRWTKGFTLEHVEWLVIDEADRLLNESFQEWVETVMPAFELRHDAVKTGSATSFLQRLGKQMSRPKLRKIILSATMTRDITKLNTLRLQNPKLVVMKDEARNLLGDNQQLAEIGGATEDNFRLPSTLSEFYVPVGEGSDKPLYLLKLLLDHLKLARPKPSTVSHRSSSVSSSESSSSLGSSSDSSSDNSSSDEDSDDSSSSSSSASSSGADTSPPSALVFTKSSESAARLARLLCSLHPPFASLVGTVTKSTKSSSSRKTLRAYGQGKLSIIFATDRASRGLDLPSLSHVVSYDVPTSVTSYVHRVGRTARAGHGGSAWTLVAHHEGRWFSTEILKGPIERIGGKRAVKKLEIQLNDDAQLKERYSGSLKELEAQVVAGTRRPDRTKPAGPR